MHTYDKIPNVWSRDEDTGKLLYWRWTNPVLETLADTDWLATEKLDGTNIRIGVDEDDRWFVKGRTDRASIPPELLAHCVGLEDRLRFAFDGPFCVYGEGVGPKIQKHGNRYGDHQRFVMFDAKVGRYWLERDALTEIALATNVPAVPFAPMTLTLRVVCEWWLDEGAKSAFYDGIAEGWVLRPVHGLLQRDGAPIRVKIKETDFARLRGGSA